MYKNYDYWLFNTRELCIPFLRIYQEILSSYPKYLPSDQLVLTCSEEWRKNIWAKKMIIEWAYLLRRITLLIKVTSEGKFMLSSYRNMQTYYYFRLQYRNIKSWPQRLLIERNVHNVKHHNQVKWKWFKSLIEINIFGWNKMESLTIWNFLDRRFGEFLSLK